MTRTRPHAIALALAAMLGFAIAAPARAINLNLDTVLGVAKGVAKSQEAANTSEADEIAVGRDIAAQTLTQYPLVRNEKLQRYVNLVGQWVAQQSDRPQLPWRFGVVKSDSVNAFAVPGGAVLITTGMMNLVSNEAELGCVIGHEVGHIVRRHHIKVMEKAALLETGTNVVASTINTGSTQGMAKEFLVKQGGEIFTRGLDRSAETEADTDGVMYAARAGYDPGACLIFMERMASRKTGDNALAALYKTHPQAADRVADVRSATSHLDGAEPGDGARPALLVRN